MTPNRYEPTVGEIPVRLLRKAPSPSELGDLVSRWDILEIAEFLVCLGESIRARRSDPLTAEVIGNQLSRYERKVLDGSGSSLIEGIARGLAIADRAEEIRRTKE